METKALEDTSFTEDGKLTNQGAHCLPWHSDWSQKQTNKRETYWKFWSNFSKSFLSDSQCYISSPRFVGQHTMHSKTRAKLERIPNKTIAWIGVKSINSQWISINDIVHWRGHAGKKWNPAPVCEKNCSLPFSYTDTKEHNIHSNNLKKKRYRRNFWHCFGRQNESFFQWWNVVVVGGSWHNRHSLRNILTFLLSGKTIFPPVAIYLQKSQCTEKRNVLRIFGIIKIRQKLKRLYLHGQSKY